MSDGPTVNLFRLSPRRVDVGADVIRRFRSSTPVVVSGDQGALNLRNARVLLIPLLLSGMALAFAVERFQSSRLVPPSGMPVIAADVWESGEPVALAVPLRSDHRIAPPVPEVESGLSQGSGWQVSRLTSHSRETKVGQPAWPVVLGPIETWEAEAIAENPFLDEPAPMRSAFRMPD